MHVDDMVRTIRGHTVLIAATLLLGSGALAPSPTAAQVRRSDTLIAVSPNVTLRVIDRGAPDAPPVVLVPGWCFTADIWHKQIDALSGRFRVVAIDPRSQGRSTIVSDANSPEVRAADLAGLIKKLNLQRPVLVGWSQGVQDVAAFAMAYGTADLGGVVFVDAQISAGAAGLDAQTAVMTLGRLPIYASAPREYLEVMMDYLFRKPLSEDERRTIVLAANRTPSSIGIANLTLDLFGRDYRPAMARLAVPSLVIVAGTAPDRDAQLRQPIPHAATAVVEGAGHAVFYDEPAKFNELLARFLDEQVRGRTP